MVLESTVHRQNLRGRCAGDDASGNHQGRQRPCRHPTSRDSLRVVNAARSGLQSLRSSQSVVLGIICLGVFSTALDQTVVVAALPAVMVDLEIPLTDLDRASWIVTGYLISYTVAMPLAGRLALLAILPALLMRVEDAEEEESSPEANRRPTSLPET